MNRKLERIFGTRNETEAPAMEPILEDNSVPEVPCTFKYQQWFEKDEALFNEETEFLGNKGIQADCRRISDGRLVFVSAGDDCQIVVTCSYIHPVQPPEVHIFDAGDSALIDENGKLDLFAHEGFDWTPETRVCDVIIHVKTLLSVAGHLESGKTDSSEEKEDNVE